MASGPLSEEQVARFLSEGFIGIPECMAAPGELERMNDSCACPLSATMPNVQPY
eukprot:SAG31_NODE_3059_length_4678_cov_1.833657_2_plen_54_part_00